MNVSLFCKNCHDVVLKSTSDTTKLRCKLLVFKDGKSYAVCKGCDSEIEVPLSLDMSRVPTAVPVYVRNRQPK